MGDYGLGRSHDSPAPLMSTTAMALSARTGGKDDSPSEWLRVEGGERHGEVIRGSGHRSRTEPHLVSSGDVDEQPAS